MRKAENEDLAWVMHCLGFSEFFDVIIYNVINPWLIEQQVADKKMPRSLPSENSTKTFSQKLNRNFLSEKKQQQLKAATIAQFAL